MSVVGGRRDPNPPYPAHAQPHHTTLTCRNIVYQTAPYYIILGAFTTPYPQDTHYTCDILYYTRPYCFHTIHSVTTPSEPLPCRQQNTASSRHYFRRQVAWGCRGKHIKHIITAGWEQIIESLFGCTEGFSQDIPPRGGSCPDLPRPLNAPNSSRINHNTANHCTMLPYNASITTFRLPFISPT